MKNLAKILMPFLVLSSTLVSGCDNNQPKADPIKLSYGDYNFKTFGSEETKISLKNISDKITAKESFMFAVKPKHCSCWDDFVATCEKYIKENNLICNWIDYDDFLPYATTLKVLISESSTQFFIIKEGEVGYHLNSVDNHDELAILSKFKAFMNEAISAPTCMYINEENYDSLIASDKSAVVYFAKTGCPDCQYFDKTILKDYIKQFSDSKTIYILDIATWVGTDVYQAKKDKFGLSEVNNPDYGYKTGYVPYLSYVSNGEFLSGAVVFNDKIEKVDDKYVVTDSYFSEQRIPTLHYLDMLDGARLNLEGIEVNEDNVLTSGGWNQSDAVKYYKPLIYSFLKTFLPNTSFTI